MNFFGKKRRKGPLPIIGGCAGGAVEAVEECVTGYNVNPCEIDELVEKVTYLLANPDKARAMGAKKAKKRHGIGSGGLF